MADEIHRQGGRQRFLQGLSHSERLDAALSGNKRLHYRNASEPSGSLWRREVFSSRLENRRLGDFNSTRDRKSTRLNSSHTVISYAVFCLKKKNLHSSGAPQHASRVIRVQVRDRPPPLPTSGRRANCGR